MIFALVTQFHVYLYWIDRFLNVKVAVAIFNWKKALVEAFSVVVKLQTYRRLVQYSLDTILTCCVQLPLQVRRQTQSVHGEAQARQGLKPRSRIVVCETELFLSLHYYWSLSLVQYICNNVIFPIYFIDFFKTKFKP